MRKIKDTKNLLDPDEKELLRSFLEYIYDPDFGDVGEEVAEFRVLSEKQKKRYSDRLIENFGRWLR